MRGRDLQMDRTMNMTKRGASEDAIRPVIRELGNERAIVERELMRHGPTR
jgi:hypothetical protein